MSSTKATSRRGNMSEEERRRLLRKRRLAQQQQQQAGRSTRATSSRRATTVRTTTSSTAARARASTTTARGRTTRSTASQGQSKRPKWDLKGRLEDLEKSKHETREQISKLRGRVQSANENVANLKQQLEEKKHTVTELATTKQVLKQDLTKYQDQIDDLARQNKRLMDKMRQNQTAHELEQSRLQSKLVSTESQLQESRIECDSVRQEKARMRTQTIEQASEIRNLQEAIKKLEDTVRQREDTITEREATIADLQQQVAGHLDNIAQLESDKQASEMQRRKLHNYIQELKGNIRVMCRVRPILLSDNQGNNDHSFSFPIQEGGRILEIKTSDNNRKKNDGSLASMSNRSSTPSTFKFDKVFAPEQLQHEVFAEIAHVVQSALDGYNTCIFAYGQTGSGKTFTMEGPEHPTGETEGMIPRAVVQIFQSAEKLKEIGWTYRFRVSFLEIYNERIRDLAVVTSNGASGSNNQTKLDIKKDSEGNPYVPGLTITDVTHPAQVAKLLQRACKRRTVAGTDKNDRSSRSHSIFQIRIKGRNNITRNNANGLLNLIDLAGSERLKDSGATGDRLKETQAINKSLSCLGDVIAALANKASHIPYRNSKLTHLLQTSLGGNSKTLMFVNISPADRDLKESINSLRFASKVNACDIGIARKVSRVKF